MELLLAITLFSIIAIAIYSSLAAGIKVHKRGSTIGGEYGDLRIAFDRIGQDLRTAVHVNDIFCVEESQKIYFLSAQVTASGTYELYKISYSWEKEKNYFTLLRLKETYIDSLQNEHAKPDKVLDNIKKIDFTYGYVKKGLRGEQEFQWREELEEKALPRLVRLNIEINNEKFNKVIYCPSGKMGELKG